MEKCKTIADIVGGVASDYYEHVDNLKSSPVEDIIFMIMDE